MSRGALRKMAAWTLLLLVLPTFSPTLAETDPDTSQVAITSPQDGAALPSPRFEVQGSVHRVTGPAPAENVLYLVGDGTTAVGADNNGSPNYPLASAGNSNRETKYTTEGPWQVRADFHPFLPTFLGTEAATLSGDPIQLHTFVDYAFPANGVQPSCALVAHVFDHRGIALATNGEPRVFAEPGLGGFREIVFSISPRAGSYPSLHVQLGTDAACGAFPATWAWGTAALNARLQLGANDFLGVGTERVEIFVDAEADPRVIVPVTTNATLPDASWEASLNLGTLVGLHTLRARWTAAAGQVLSEDAVTVTIAAPLPGSVSIASPADGASVQPPVAFEGTYDTGGFPASTASPPAASLDEALPPDVAAWYAAPFVQEVLGSAAFERLSKVLTELPGFLAALPKPDEGGHVLALFQGPAPSLLAVESPWPLRSLGQVQPEPLQYPAQGPQGPNLPRVQSGVGPGGAIHAMLNVGEVACTASFLFENPGTGKYYLATAGHCVMNSGAVSSVTHPQHRAAWVSVCIWACINNILNLGRYIQLNPNPATGYHPVAFGLNGGVGADFGLIEMPPGLHHLLRPWMWQWGGPQSVGRARAGDLLAHYGHGLAVGATFPHQGRLAVAFGGTAQSGVGAVGWVLGGDSGSSIGLAGRTDRLVIGGAAAGTITHSITVVGLPLMFFTDLQVGLDYAQAALGFRPVLVTEDAIIRSSEPLVPLSAQFSSPAPSQAFSPTTDPTVNVQGTATFPTLALPGDTTLTYFLHRQFCSPLGTPVFMSTVDTPNEGGNGCGNALPVVGGIQEDTAGPFEDIYRATPVPGADIWVDPSRPIEARIFVSGPKPTPTSPVTPPSLINDIEAKLTYASTVVGRQRLTNQMVLDAPTEIVFSMMPQAARIPAGGALTLYLILHHTVGPVVFYYDAPAVSRVLIPQGVPKANAVELSLDDPSFAPQNRVPATGTAAWSAPWDITSVAPGLHQLYARAVQDGVPQDPPTALPVRVLDRSPHAAFTAQAQFLDVQFTDASIPGDAPLASWAWDFGDGATSNDQHPFHAYADAGTLDVQLTVTDATGRTSTATQPVAVVHPPYTLQLRVLDAATQEVLPWTRILLPPPDSSGAWAHTWTPTEPPAPGTYSVEVRLLRDGALEASDASSFSIPGPNQPPQAAIEGPPRARPGHNVPFDASASADPDGTLAAYDWDFGDGTHGSGAQVKHAYAQLGVYDVRLVVRDNSGAEGAATHRISVVCPPGLAVEAC